VLEHETGGLLSRLREDYRSAVRSEKRQRVNVAFAFLIDKTGWIFTREVVIGEGGRLRITRLSANSLIKSID
jgi:hypothetical protein